MRLYTLLHTCANKPTPICRKLTYVFSHRLNLTLPPAQPEATFFLVGILIAFSFAHSFIPLHLFTCFVVILFLFSDFKKTEGSDC